MTFVETRPTSAPAGFTGGTPWPEIRTRTASRMRAAGPLQEEMRRVANHYNGDFVLPNFEDMGNLAPALITDAIDNAAMRAAGVLPSITCPALTDKPTGAGSFAYADVRRRALHAMWWESGFELGLARFYRHLAGYATAALVVRPGFKLGRMSIEIRDPLTAFPELKAPEDLSPPMDVAFVSGRSAQWLRATYPKCRQENDGPIPRDSSPEELWDLVEWWDNESMVIGLLGRRKSWNTTGRTRTWEGFTGYSGQAPNIELFRVPNPMGEVPAVIPHRVTLDRVASQVANMVNRVEVLAKLAALDMIASEKSIFPDTYIVGNGPGVTPKLVGGEWKDGRTGEVNLVVDATQVNQLHSQPSPAGTQAADRQERNVRMTTGLLPQMGGETYGALRTGRGMDSLMEAAVDPRIHELHLIGEHALTSLNKALLKGARAWFGDKKFQMFTGWLGDSLVEFTPNKHFETGYNSVRYPIPGADVQTTTIILGQMEAADGIPKSMYRAMHPWIPDHDKMERKIFEEKMVETVGIAFLEQAKAGALPLVDAVNLLSELRKTGDIVTAIEHAHDAAQKRQATVPEPTPDGAPAPEAMPGLGQPGDGAATQPAPMPPAIAGPTDSQANLRRLTLALKTNDRGIGD